MVPVIHDLPGVGQNLQDHIWVSGMIWISHEVLQNQTNSEEDLSQWQQFGTGPLSSLGGLEAVANIKSSRVKPSVDWPDLQILFLNGGTLAGGGLLREPFGISDETWNAYYEPFVKYESSMMFGTYLLRPKSRGQVRLRSDSPFDHPSIDPNYLSDDEDVKVLVESCKLTYAMGNSKFFQKHGMTFIPALTPGCEDIEAYTDQYWECLARHQTSTAFHPVGTAKMGPVTDPMAVVDAELRVHGVKKLRAIDASIMPEIISGKPVAAIIMIGEKGSDLIKKTWKL